MTDRAPQGWSRHSAHPGPSSSQTAVQTEKKARFQVILLKVSQNPKVSPKYVEKACHSPCVQNGLQMSPLDFLGFSISPAFSHKELMGLFDHEWDFSVKMTKCRRNVTVMSREVVTQIPPRPRQQADSCGRSSSGLSAVFSTD